MGANYLLLGPEIGEKTDFIEQLKSSMPEGTEFYKIYPYENTAEQLSDALSSMSLFASARFIWFEVPKEYLANTSFTRPNVISKEIEEIIVSYLSSPDEDAVFVLSVPESQVNRNIEKFFPKEDTGAFVRRIFWELTDDRKPGWVKSFFRKNNMRIDDDAVSHILLLVENDTSEMRTVCSQLALFLQSGNSCNVTEDDIETYLTSNRHIDGYTLFSYIAKLDLESALLSLDTLLVTVSDPVSAIFPALVYCFRRLESARSMLDRGSSQFDAFSAANVLGRPARIARPNDRLTYQSAVSNFKTAEVRSIIASLAEYEVLIREAGPDMYRINLQRLFVEIICNKGRKTTRVSFASF